MHDGLASLLAERLLEILSVVGPEEVSGDGLTAVLVYPLKDLRKKSGGLEMTPLLLVLTVCREVKEGTNLVTRRVAEAGEEGEELGADARGGLVLEDDGVQLRNTANARLVAHQSLGDGVDLWGFRG